MSSGILGGAASVVFICSVISDDNSGCPSNTFAANNLAAGLAIFLPIIGAFLLMFAVAIFTHLGASVVISKDWPGDTPLIPRTRNAIMNALAVAVCLVMVAMFAKTTYTGSYTCFAKNQIIIHPEAYGPSQIFSWDDVTGVRSDCYVFRNRKGGSLTLSMRTGQMLVVSLRTFPDEVYRPVRDAIAGRHLTYTRSQNVVSTKCPNQLYSALLDWP